MKIIDVKDVQIADTPHKVAVIKTPTPTSETKIL